MALVDLTQDRGAAQRVDGEVRFGHGSRAASPRRVAHDLEEEPMSEDRPAGGVRTRTVRPWWAWIALLVMVLGVLLIGWGVIVGDWAWAAPGLVVLVGGGVLALCGGFFYDVQGGGSIHAQVHDVLEGTDHEIPVVGTIRSEDQVKRDAKGRWLGHS
jgi:hypothetical protein